jgi:AraC-like DNA-binding protein
MRDLRQRLDFDHRGRAGSLPYFRFPYSFHDPEMAQAILRLHEALESHKTTLERDTRLLTTIARLLQRYGEHQEVARSGNETRAVRLTRDYLQAHACSSISLDTLAAAAGLSPFHLLRVFREQVGVPPHAYQTQQRVQIAHQLLLQGTPPAQAAAATGFVDQSHLTRHFKRLTGVAPGAFQRASGVTANENNSHRNFVQA